MFYAIVSPWFIYVICVVQLCSVACSMIALFISFLYQFEHGSNNNNNNNNKWKASCQNWVELTVTFCNIVLKQISTWRSNCGESLFRLWPWTGRRWLTLREGPPPVGLGYSSPCRASLNLSFVDWGAFSGWNQFPEVGSIRSWDPTLQAVFVIQAIDVNQAYVSSMKAWFWS